MLEKKKLLLGKGMKTEDQSDFTYAAAEAALAGKESFEFGGKEYPVEISKEQAQKIVKKDISEQVGSDTDLSDAVMDSDYGEDGSFTKRLLNEPPKLDSSKYSYTDLGSWANRLGVINPNYRKRFNIKEDIPIFAEKNTNLALAAAGSKFSGSSDWSVWVGKVPNKHRAKYDSILVDGKGFILQYQGSNSNLAEPFLECTKALISSGFNKIVWGQGSGKGQKPSHFIVAGRGGTGLFLSSTSKPGQSPRPFHPVYHLHRDKIDGYRQGKHILFHREDYTSMPVTTTTKFSNKSLQNAQVDLSVELNSVKIPWNASQNEIYGDSPNSNFISYSIKGLNDLASKYPEKGKIYTDAEKDFLVSQGIWVAGTDTPESPSGLDVITAPEPDIDSGGIADPEKIENVITKFINKFKRLQWFSTELSNIWTVTTKAIAPAIGFLIAHKGLTLSLSGALALGIAGPFLYRAYLSNRRNKMNAREASRDRDLMRKLSAETQTLKASLSDEEIKKLIQELERSEERDPETRRLYDL